MIKTIYNYVRDITITLWHWVGEWKYGNWVRYPIAIFLIGWIMINFTWYIIRPVYQWTTAEYQTVLVTDKYIKEGQFRVSLKRQDGTSSNAVVEDSWIWLTWNASDRYRMLELNKEAKVKVAGIRWDFMSWFPNVVRVSQ